MVMVKKKKCKKQLTSHQRRPYKKKKQVNYHMIIVSLLILLGFSGLLYQHRFHISNSYEITQTATITPTSPVTLYCHLFDFNTDKLKQTTTVQVTGYRLTHLRGKTMTLAKVKLRGHTYYLDAKHLQIQHTNAINQYIASLNYPHTEITKNIYHQFAQKSYFGISGKPKGIIIHDTGNDSSSIQSEVAYMEKNYKSTGVFVHSFLDKNNILQIADDSYMAQGAGPKGNPYYLQFEMTHEHNKDNFARQTANAAYYAAFMLKKYKLPVTLGQKDTSGTVWTHQMVSSYLGGTNHQDPDDYWAQAAADFFASSYSIKNFVDLIQAYYNQL